MSDTTITAEERARLRSVLSEHGTPQVEDRIILRLLNTIEQAEARAIRWTHEPPKVAGWYYVRQREDIDKPWSKPRIVSIKTLTIAPSEYWQFAGPIDPPID